MTEPRTAAGLTRQELLDLFDRTAGQPRIREAIRRTLQPEAAARASLDEDALAVMRDLYSIAVGEHGHDETHSADWPACLPAHMAFNRYRAILAEEERP